MWHFSDHNTEQFHHTYTVRLLRGLLRCTAPFSRTRTDNKSSASFVLMCARISVILFLLLKKYKLKEEKRPKVCPSEPVSEETLCIEGSVPSLWDTVAPSFFFPVMFSTSILSEDFLIAG